MKIERKFRITIIAAAMLAAFGNAQADDALIAEYSKPDSSASVGGNYLDNDRPQLGKYDGMNDKGGNLVLDADVSKRDDATGTWKTLVMRNMGLDTRQVEVGYEEQGDFAVSVGYNQIVSRNPYTYMTGMTGVGSTVMQYGTVGANTAAAQAGLYPATTEVHLGTERDISSANVLKYLTKELSFNVNYSHEKKTGTLAWGRGVNPEFAVQPISSITQQIDTVLNYTTDVFQISGGLNASWYDNDNHYVNTIGGSQTNVPTSTTNAAGQTFLSMPLNNQAVTALLHGGYNFSKTTRGTFKASYTQATQHGSLESLTNALLTSGARGTSGYIPFTPGAPSDLNGKVDTSLFEVGLSSRPMKELSIVANARYQDRNDKTPVQDIDQYYTYRCSNTGTTTQYSGDLPTNANCGGANTVNTIAGPTLIENNPRDFKNTTAKLEGTYRLPYGYALTAGWGYAKQERTYETVAGVYDGVVKMRANTEENAWRAELRKGLTETLSGSVSFAHLNRDGSTWLPAEGPAAATWPINFLNPVPFSDRKRDKWKLVLDWLPTESTSLQLNYEHSKDNYGASTAGLVDGTAELISLDASWAITNEWSLNAWASSDTTKVQQVSYTYDTRTTPASTNSTTNWACTSVPGMTIANGCTTNLSWDMQQKDTGDTIGIGIRGTPVSQWIVGADMQYTKIQNKYPTTSNVPNYLSKSAVNGPTTNLGLQGLPDVENKLTRVSMFGQYAYTKASSVRADVIYERWQSNDWTYKVWNTGATALIPFQYMDGTQVLSDPDQKTTMFRLTYNYKFQ
ncbi:MAG: MtrB/PioB family decaheme-associated outer membrane protein [Rhodocyclaceae bacterium]|nr:MtrB/PioB family decaheme-associated outer membrane protein [Rhodocyclaceae bacterium]